MISKMRKKRKYRKMADTPLPRKRNEFSRALSAAKKALAVKTKERDRDMQQLRQLNIHIPNLERTVKALEAQLGRTGPVTRPTSQSDSKKVGEVLPLNDALAHSVFFRNKAGIQKFDGATVENISDDIPPEIRAQLPPEDLSKFGSHFGATPPEKEDFLPEITEGKPLIPEKP
jgi:hypothetical protein